MGSRLLCLAALVLLITTSSVLSQQPTETEIKTWGPLDGQSYDWANGKAWALLDAQSKITFVNGIEEGMMLLQRELDSGGMPSGVDVVAKKQVDNLTVNGFRMSDIAKQIDSFYADTSNLRIPIVDAYKYAMKKMHGAKTLDLENYVAELRQRYNKQ